MPKPLTFSDAPPFEANTPQRVQLAQIIERVGVALDAIERNDGSEGARAVELRAIMRCLFLDFP